MYTDKIQVPKDLLKRVEKLIKETVVDYSGSSFEDGHKILDAIAKLY